MSRVGVRVSKLASRLYRLGVEVAASSIVSFKPLPPREGSPPIISDRRLILHFNILDSCKGLRSPMLLLLIASTGRGLVEDCTHGVCKPFYAIDYVHHYVPLGGEFYGRVRVSLEPSGYLGYNPKLLLVALTGLACVEWNAYRAGLWLIYASQLLSKLHSLGELEYSVARELEELVSSLDPNPTPGQLAVLHLMLYLREPWSERYVMEIPAPRFLESYVALTYGLEEARRGFSHRPPVEQQYGQLLSKLPGLLSKLYKRPLGGQLLVFSYSHLDLSWLWDRLESSRRLIEQYVVASRLREMYPRLLYVVGPKSYVEDLESRGFDTSWVCRRIGGVYVEVDLWSTPEDLLVHNILLGEGDVVLLPDCFGYPASLPDLLSKLGARILLIFKVKWNDTSIFPYHTFRWEGLHGGIVVDVLHTSYREKCTPASIDEYWRTYRESSITGFHAYSYAYGDGGRPPTPEMMEALELSSRIKSLPSLSTNIEEYVSRLTSSMNHLPSWKGEIYLENHRGVYTTDTRIKNMVWWSYHAVNGLAVLSALLRKKLVSINDVKRLLKLCFHDTLSGTLSTHARRVEYSEAYKLLSSLYSRARGSKGVLNLQPWPRLYELSWRIVGDTYEAKAIKLEPLAVTPLSRSKWTVTSIRVDASKPSIKHQQLEVVADNEGILVNWSGHRMRLGLLVAPDRPYDWDAWNLDEYTVEKLEAVTPSRVRLLKSSPGLLLGYEGSWGWCRVCLRVRGDGRAFTLVLNGELKPHRLLALGVSVEGLRFTSIERMQHFTLVSDSVVEEPTSRPDYVKPFNPWFNARTSSLELLVASTTARSLIPFPNRIVIPVARSPKYPDPSSLLRGFTSKLVVVPHEEPYWSSEAHAIAEEELHPPIMVGVEEAKLPVEIKWSGPKPIIRLWPEDTHTLSVRVYNQSPVPVRIDVNGARRLCKCYGRCGTSECRIAGNSVLVDSFDFEWLKVEF